MTPRLALPLARTPEQVRICRPFGADPETYARFGLQGHNGLDFEVIDGELVLAVDDGEVVEVRLDAAGYGVTVKLTHVWGESRYAHGQRGSVPLDFDLGHVVRRGERVLLASGPRLHLGLRLRRDDGTLDYSDANGFGGWVDPLPLLRDSVGLTVAVPPAEKSFKRAAAAR